MGTGKFAGLLYRRIYACKGNQFLGCGKTMDVANFAENDGCKNFSNTGNRMQRAIKLVMKTTDLFPKLC